MAKYSSRKKRKYSRRKYSRKRSNRKKYSRKRSNRKKYSRRKYSRRKKLYNQMGGATGGMDEVEVTDEMIDKERSRNEREAALIKAYDKMERALEESQQQVKTLQGKKEEGYEHLLGDLTAKLKSGELIKVEKFLPMGEPREGPGIIYSSVPDTTSSQVPQPRLLPIVDSSKPGSEAEKEGVPYPSLIFKVNGQGVETTSEVQAAMELVHHHELLPAGWTMNLSLPGSYRPHFYLHAATGTSQWELPPGAAPGAAPQPALIKNGELVQQFIFVCKPEHLRTSQWETSVLPVQDYGDINADFKHLYPDDLKIKLDNGELIMVERSLEWKPSGFGMVLYIGDSDWAESAMRRGMHGLELDSHRLPIVMKINADSVAQDSGVPWPSRIFKINGEHIYTRANLKRLAPATSGPSGKFVFICKPEDMKESWGEVMMVKERARRAGASEKELEALHPVEGDEKLDSSAFLSLAERYEKIKLDAKEERRAAKEKRRAARRAAKDAEQGRGSRNMKIFKIEMEKGIGFGMIISPSDARVQKCTPGGQADLGGVPWPSTVVKIDGKNIENREDYDSALEEATSNRAIPFEFLYDADLWDNRYEEGGVMVPPPQPSTSPSAETGAGAVAASAVAASQSADPDDDAPPLQTVAQSAMNLQKISISIEKSPNGFGLEISDNGHVVKSIPGGVSEARGVPWPSRIVEINGIPVSTKEDVIVALGDAPDPVPFVFLYDADKWRNPYNEVSDAPPPQTSTTPPAEMKGEGMLSGLDELDELEDVRHWNTIQEEKGGDAF